MEQKYYDANECANLLRVKRPYFLRAYATRPDFPSHYGLSTRKKLWEKKEVDRWIERQKLKD